jgi:hypothetical protein
LFHVATFDELGHDFQISNASKLVKVPGFPPNLLLSSWMRDVAMSSREGKSATTFWDREFRSVKFCDRGSCEKDVVSMARGWVFNTWQAIELLAGMHITRQLCADVAYDNIRRKNHTLKINVPPGTLTETTGLQPNGVVTPELTLKLRIAKVVVTIDPPSTCRPKLSGVHPLLTGPGDTELSRYPHLPPVGF